MEAVQVGDRDDEGGGAEEEEDQHLPHPEPVVDRGPHSNTWKSQFVIYTDDIINIFKDSILGPHISRRVVGRWAP